MIVVEEKIQIQLTCSWELTLANKIALQHRTTELWQRMKPYSDEIWTVIIMKNTLLVEEKNIKELLVQWCVVEWSELWCRVMKTNVGKPDNITPTAVRPNWYNWNRYRTNIIQANTSYGKQATGAHASGGSKQEQRECNTPEHNTARLTAASQHKWK